MKNVKKWWKNLWVDSATKYLAQATDQYDLENRMKELQRKGIWL